VLYLFPRRDIDILMIEAFVSPYEKHQEDEHYLDCQVHCQATPTLSWENGGSIAEQKVTSYFSLRKYPLQSFFQ
jgi:hypothetical protein